jgi:hypothetical protein
MFNDSIENNIETIRELLQGVPPSERDRAKRAAMLIEKAVQGIMKDNHGNPAVGLGMAFAIYSIAQKLVQTPQEGDKSSGLIQLLT